MHLEHTAWDPPMLSSTGVSCGSVSGWLDQAVQGWRLSGSLSMVGCTVGTLTVLLPTVCFV